jgi:hypothetical protein
MKKTIVLAITLFVVCAVGYSQPAKTGAGPTQADPLSLEKWFVGTWICEGTEHSSQHNAGVNFTDRFVFKMTLRDSWLTFHIDQL